MYQLHNASKSVLVFMLCPLKTLINELPDTLLELLFNLIITQSKYGCLLKTK